MRRRRPRAVSVAAMSSSLSVFEDRRCVRVDIREQAAQPAPAGRGPCLARSVGDNRGSRRCYRQASMREHRQVSVPPIAGAEAAQAFQALSAALRQRTGQPAGSACRRSDVSSRRFAALVRRVMRHRKIAAAVGLAHMNLCASALHSQSGDGLKACSAKRRSSRNFSWNSDLLIAHAAHGLQLINH